MRKTIMVLSLAAVSCTAPVVDQSSINYIQSGFGQLNLVREGMAILPVIAGEGQETFRRPMNESIEHYLDTLIPEINYVSWNYSLAQISENDLTGEYAAAIASFKETAIVPKRFLQTCSELMGVRYLLFLGSGEFGTSESTEYNPLVGIYKRRKGSIYLIGQIWDAETGSVVWEAVGAGEASSASKLKKMPAFYKYVDAAAKGLIEQLRSTRL